MDIRRACLAPESCVCRDCRRGPGPGDRRERAGFSLVDRILLRPLPSRSRPSGGHLGDHPELGSEDFRLLSRHRSLREAEPLVRWIAGWQWAEYTLTGRGDPRRILGEAVTYRFFEMLGVPAARGRTFGPADLSGGPAVVLSDAGWKSIFGGAPGVVGQTLTLDGRAYSVLGIMPRGFEFYPRQALFWTLLTPADVARQASAKFHSMGAVARLRPGVSMAAAESEIAALRAALERTDPDEILHAGAMVRGLQEEFTWLAGRGLRAGLLLLFAAVAFVLLIACANVANLLVGRALERRREIAIRAALGAGRGRLIRQILTENLLLSALGAVAGMAWPMADYAIFWPCSPWNCPSARRFPELARARFRRRSVRATAVVSGLLPALQASGFHSTMC